MSSAGKLLVVDDAPRTFSSSMPSSPRAAIPCFQPPREKDALTKAATEDPDLVLLDVLMPEMDGYEVCRRLREEPSTRLLPVIMITASGNQEKVRALEAGADDFVQKPFDQSELLARVQSLLRIKRFQDELAELNRTLESRVQRQVEDLERVGQLKRFLSPQVVELVISDGEAKLARDAPSGDNDGLL